MATTDSEWMDCVRWCNEGLPADSIDLLILSLVELAESSRYSRPILVAKRSQDDYLAAGYLSLYPGSIGVIGNLRVEASATQIGHNRELETSLLADVIQSLCSQAVEQGVEIVQAISTIELDQVKMEPGIRPVATADESLMPPQDMALIRAKVLPIAKLVQMEHTLPDPTSLSASKSGKSIGKELRFVHYAELPTRQWHLLLEATYEGTLDVPELNGVRSITNTLEGYASILEGPPTSWWVVLSDDQPVGCLLLAQNHPSCELTYLGLVPAHRGQGASKQIMNFLLDWCKAREIDRITLAVDVRNVPAIQLYQAYGFKPTKFVQAWIFSPAGF